jgi:hypothetical protein
MAKYDLETYYRNVTLPGLHNFPPSGTTFPIVRQSPESVILKTLLANGLFATRNPKDLSFIQSLADYPRKLSPRQLWYAQDFINHVVPQTYTLGKRPERRKSNEYGIPPIDIDVSQTPPPTTLTQQNIDDMQRAIDEVWNQENFWIKDEYPKQQT